MSPTPLTPVNILQSIFPNTVDVSQSHEFLLLLLLPPNTYHSVAVEGHMEEFLVWHSHNQNRSSWSGDVNSSSNKEVQDALRCALSFGLRKR